MRQIATIESVDHAERFQDFLIARGIKCSLEDGDDGCTLWIVDEDRVAEARAELVRFRQQPDDPRYANARAEANAVLQAEAAKRKAARRNVVNVSDRWRQPTAMNCPLTVGMIVVCIFVFVEMHLMGDERGLSQELFFSTDGTWNAIKGGDWWRLLTPMFMHGGLLHILFNLIAWWDFGLAIEGRKGSLRFLLIVTATSLAANLLQFEFGSWRFLGLSGVVFGLFGYLWVKGKLDPDDGLGVSAYETRAILLWYIICWFGWFMPIANWAHTGGLMMGVLLGVMSAAWRRLRRRSI